MQTAVELFMNYIKKNEFFISNDLIKVFEQAKEMEKQQIIDAHDMGYIDGGNHKKNTAEMYFAETYGSKGSDECYFEQTTNTSSATICKHCGREKFLHKQ